VIHQLRGDVIMQEEQRNDAEMQQRHLRETRRKMSKITRKGDHGRTRHDNCKATQTRARARQSAMYETNLREQALSPSTFSETQK